MTPRTWTPSSRPIGKRPLTHVAHHPYPPRPHRRHAGPAGRHRRQDRGLRPPRARTRQQAHQPVGQRVRRSGLRPGRPARRRRSASQATAGRLRRCIRPGHAPDHLCFALEGTGVLFSGDHVMGWNTSVVAPPEGNMGDYIRSLQLLIERSDERLLSRPWRAGRGAAAAGQGVPAAPAHARAGDPGLHPRRQRTPCAAIVPVIYRDLDPKLLNAASLSVLAHVEHLIERGLVALRARRFLLIASFSPS